MSTLAPETPHQHIQAAERFAAAAADVALQSGTTIGRDIIPQLQVMATLAQAHAQIAMAMLLDQATEGSGALKVAAEVDR